MSNNIDSITYFLNTSRPHADLWSEGRQYRVHANGFTIDTETKMPALGTRFPLVALRVAVYAWFAKRPFALPLTGLSILSGYALFILAQTLNPAGYEVVNNVLSTVFMWAFGVLLIVPACLASALVLREFSGGFSYRYEKPSGNIAAGPIAYDMAPDILVTWDGVESIGAFNERVQDLSSRATPGKWVAIFVPGERWGMVYIGEGRSIPIDRVNPPWQFGFPSDMLIVPPGTMFTGETAEQYHAYVSRMFAYLPEWIRSEKINQRPDHAGITFLESLNAKAIAVCVFVLLAIPAFAQPKSVAVADYLGAKVAEQPGKKSGTQVIYTFERGAPLKRTGFGERSYTALLRSVPAYSDASFGKCISVTVGGKEQGPSRYTAVKRERVATVEQASIQVEGTESDDPVRPRKYTGSVQPMPESDGFGGAGITIPDSIEMVERIEGAKQKIGIWKTQAWQVAKPIWGLIMYVFSSLFFLLLAAGGILRYLAKSAADESFAEAYGTQIFVGRWLVTIHQNTAGALLLITWACFVVGLLNFFMWLAWLELPVWAIIVIWAVGLWISGSITNKIVPNIKPAGNQAAREIQTGGRQWPGING